MRKLPDEVLYDQRLIKRHIAEGLITEEQVRQRLEQLPDLAEEGDTVDVSALLSDARRGASSR